MNGQIFISYRRDESRWSARSLYDRLCGHFGRKQIFIDIDTIALGDDFVKAIEKTVGECDVVIAVIGARWLTSKDEYDGRRLDNLEDFVRREIATALKREISVVPVLMDGALMPRSSELPDDLKPLIRRNALQVTDTGFDNDCRRLVGAIEQILEEAKAGRREREEEERREAKRRATEAKERLKADRRQPHSPPPGSVASPTSPGKRKLRPVPIIVTLLALIIALAVSMAIYYNVYYNNKSPVPAQSPGVVNQALNDRLQCFLIGKNGHLYDNFWNGEQWVWVDQGTPPPGAAAGSSSSAVYQTLNYRLHCFVVGKNGHLYDNFWNGQQWVWEDRGTASDTTAASSANAIHETSLDRLVCFVVGSDGYLYDTWGDDTWGAQQWVWQNQGPPPGTTAISSPSAVYQASPDPPTWRDRLHCFVIGKNGHLYDDFWKDHEWVWQDKGPPPGTAGVSSPSAVYQHDRLHCFVVGKNGHLYDNFWNGQQWVWEDRGTASDTTAASSANAVYQTPLDRLVCFVVGNNGRLYDNYWNGQQWIWEEQGSPPGTTAVDSPGAIYETPADRLHCFVIGKNGHLFDRFRNGQQWVWEDVSLGSIRK